MRESTKYKYQTGRNMLGVRVLIEDWIHGLEIGHVMQLNPMLASELQSNLGKSDSGLGKVHELLKDPMLEKLVLLVVSLFSISTETRLSSEQSDTLSVLSEPWHGQSMLYAAYYLPQECPLVDHLVDSYFKHYSEDSFTPLQ